jgi:hypothetical protein
MKPEELEEFSHALLSAYPTRAELDRLLTYGLDWELDHIAGEGPLPDVVLKLLRYAKAQGKLESLLKEAHARNANNPRLKRFYDHILGGGPAPLPSPPEGPPTKNSPPAGRPQLKLVLAFAAGDRALALKLEVQLVSLVQARLITSPWSTDKIAAGQLTERETARHFGEAEVLLPLLSADFFATESKLLERIRQRSQAGALVVPVLLRPVLLDYSWLKDLQAYPRDSQGRAKALTTWSNQDEAWLSVLEGLRAAIQGR